MSTKIKLYFALTDEIPLIVGFKDLLSRFKIECDYKNKDAFIMTEEK